MKAKANGVADARAEMRRRTRRSFLVGGVAAIGGAACWRWMANSPEVGGLHDPLRRAENFNALVSHRVLGEGRMAPTFPASEAVADVRVNGDIGLNLDLDPSRWRLQLTGIESPQAWKSFVPDVNAWDYDEGSSDEAKSEKALSQTHTSLDQPPNDSDEAGPPEPGLLLTMSEIQQLPRAEMVTQLKCIEGWSEVVHWGGVKMQDFVEKYKPARVSGGSRVRYVGLETPDGQYYVGLDLSTAMHPQTLLCFEINGQSLTPEHGAPLRLVTPLKYGIKHLKQIGKISFTDQRPKDYWAENGYDWDAGH